LAGNGNIASDQFSINYDNTAPIVSITSDQSNATNSSLFDIIITFSEEITNFELSDIVVSNGTASNLATTDNTVFTVDIAPEVDGAVTIDINDAVASDLAGNGNIAADQFSINYDNTAPIVSITSDQSGATNSSAFVVTITFSEEITNFELSDIVVSNGTASNLATTDNIVFTVDIVPANDGVLTVDIDTDAVVDLAGNSNVAADQFSIIYDGTAPTVVLSTSKNEAVNSEVMVLTVTFSEDVEGLAGNMIVLNNGNVTNLQSDDNIVYTADLPPIEAGYITVNLAAAVVKDLAGNDNFKADEITIVYTGIEELESKGYQIYPNPVKDYLNVSSSDMNQEVNIQIMTATGQVVFSDKWKSPFVNEIDFSSYSDGMYIIQLQSNGNLVTRKVILVK
jgi:hypothetical protein